MRKINLLYYKLMCALTTILMASLLVPVTLQVLSRYTHLVPTWMWTEEASRFSLIWMIMLGTAIAVRNRRHFNIDLWPEPKTERGKALSRLAVDVIIIVFGITFFWVSAEYAFDARSELSEITEMSMGLVYVAFPVSAVSWIMFLGEQIYDDLFKVIRGEK